MSAASEQYLKDHNIHGILEFLCAQLVYAKPADPTAFLAAELRKLQAAKGGVAGVGAVSAVPSTALSMFNEADFDVMFQMMDPVNRGSLTAKQVYKAISDLGLSHEKAKVDPTVEQNYSLQQFKEICQRAQ